MHYICDTIDKEHNSFLKNFCDIGKIADITKTKYGDYSIARHERVDHIVELKVLSDNLTSSLAKAKGEQSGCFNNQMLKNARFIGVFLKVLFKLFLIFIPHQSDK